MTKKEVQHAANDAVGAAPAETPKRKSKTQPRVAKKVNGASKRRKKGDIEEKKEVRQLPLAQVVIEKGNPRQTYDEEALQRLAFSIKHAGILHPLVVRTKENDNKFYLVTGERRLRAAKMNKMESVPCIVEELMSDARAVYAQHAENAMRENLNPIEYAQSIVNLIGKTVQMPVTLEDEATGETVTEHQEVVVNATHAAQIYDISAGSVSQYVALLKLPQEIQTAIHKNEVSFAQARELCQSELTKSAQLSIFKNIMAGKLKRASDVKAAVEKHRARKQMKDPPPESKKRRGRPPQTSDEAPSVRQNLDTAIERTRHVKLTLRPAQELREGLTMCYEKHERAKTDEKKNYYKGFAAALEWMGNLRDKL